MMDLFGYSLTITCGVRGIDVERREVDVRKRLENKEFSKMRCDFLLHQVGENPCRINE